LAPPARARLRRARLAGPQDPPYHTDWRERAAGDNDRTAEVNQTGPAYPGFPAILRRQPAGTVHAALGQNTGTTS
jgi:hypothetical protein